jgi:6-phosphogluconate dehydrogenase (decarboxylating)
VGTTAHAASPGSAGSALAKLGFGERQVVLELGWDSDVDDELRFAIEDLTGTELEDEDYGDVADAVLVWFRAVDGDLVDTLVDALTNLADNGFVVLMTPRAGSTDYIDASEIEEAAVTAGLHTSGGANVSPGWSAVRLVAPRGQRR